MERIKKIADKINTIIEFNLKPSKDEELKELIALNLPNSIIQFYSKYEPQKEISLGNFRLLPIREILNEVNGFVPSTDILKHGYVTIATDYSGDVCCCDTKSDVERLVVVPHDIDFSSAEREDIESFAEEVEGNFINFLESNLKIELNSKL